MLFVCTANISRSPFLEFRARTLVRVPGIEFASGATQGVTGQSLDPQMLEELAKRGIDGSTHRSKPVSSQQVAWADLILTATREHREVLLRRHAGIVMKTLTLGQFLAAAEKAPSTDPVRAAFSRRSAALREDDIPDPYGRGSRAAADCALHCDELLLRLGRVLTPLPTST